MECGKLCNYVRNVRFISIFFISYKKFFHGAKNYIQKWKYHRMVCSSLFWVLEQCNKAIVIGNKLNSTQPKFITLIFRYNMYRWLMWKTKCMKRWRLRNCLRNVWFFQIVNGFEIIEKCTCVEIEIIYRRAKVVELCVVICFKYSFNLVQQLYTIVIITQNYHQKFDKLCLVMIQIKEEVLRSVGYW